MQTMKSFTKFAAAAALTLATFGGASAASAATFVDIAISGTPGANQIAWDGSTKTLTITDLLTNLNFDDAIFADFGGQDAILNLTAVSTDALVVGPPFTQTGLNGTFEFRSTDLSTVLLRGTFTNYWIQGFVGGRSGSLDSVAGSADFYSEVAALGGIDDDNFAFSFSNVTAPFSITNGKLNSFTANNVVGTFGGAVPEPGTWALMILGFGGAGFMLRSRRREISAAA